VTIAALFMIIAAAGCSGGLRLLIAASFFNTRARCRPPKLEIMARMIRVSCLLAALLPSASVAVAENDNPEIQPYSHILVIIAENHSFEQIIGNPMAPLLNHLATTYGSAINFFAVARPSEPNYVAMIGGDTFGIRDNDAWYCKRGTAHRYCSSATTIEPYVDHTVVARSLIDQLAEHNLTWKGYFESIPAAGSMAIYYPNAENPVAGQPSELYASKHNGFINFRTVQNDPALASKLVGFDQLLQDIATGQLPNYAHIVPNQCNDMHGLSGVDVPNDCTFHNHDGLIARGDRVIGELVAKIQSSPVWSAQGNIAIVVTWDEDNNPKWPLLDRIRNWFTEGRSPPKPRIRFDPTSVANFSGGHIPTLVITNHGPRGATDDTPYNHYSLLRSIEEAFGFHEHLGHANDTSSKVMTRLF
jgi:hypothetical protein